MARAITTWRVAGLARAGVAVVVGLWSIPSSHGQVVHRIERFSITGMSSDGRIASGSTLTVETRRSATWTVEGGINSIGVSGGLPWDRHNASGISGDGRVVVGYYGSTSPSRAYQFLGPGVYNEPVVPQSWNSLNWSHASYDGSVVVGYVGRTPVNQVTQRQAIRWTAAGGVQLLGYAGSPFGYQSYSEGVSADGNTVVGYSYEGGNDGNRSGHQGWVWTASGGTRALTDLSGQADPTTRALAVNSSGSIIVGGSDRHAVMWRDGSIIDLGIVSASSYAHARSVSDDGSIVMGESIVGDWVWTAPTGIITLRSFLESNGVALPEVGIFGDWRMTADGRTFYGYWNFGSYVVTIPTSGAPVAMAIGAAALARRRRSSRKQLGAARPSVRIIDAVVQNPTLAGLPANTTIPNPATYRWYFDTEPSMCFFADQNTIFMFKYLSDPTNGFWDPAPADPNYARKLLPGFNQTLKAHDEAGMNIAIVS